MAFETSYRGRPAAALTVQWAGRPRTLPLNRWAVIALLVVLPLLATWYLGATLYFVFHDDLLASLMTRQADMQYAYEDRISALQTQLDRASSRGLIDRNTLDTTVRDLVARGARLEARAATIDALIAQGLQTRADRRPAPLAGADNPLLAPRALDPDVSAYDAAPTASVPVARPTLRQDGSTDSSALEHGIDDVASRLARVETEQARAVADLRDPMIRAVQRMRAALAETGLPLSRWQGKSGGGFDVGGPFVPLSSNAGDAGFDESVALVRDAVLQQAQLRRVVDRVPLRKPLEGPLEVTSTFGPRLDPFFGRPAMHTGIDLHEEYGDEVEATAAGVVTIAGAQGGYGNMVEIDHGNGLATRYAHLSSIGVSVGQKIVVGQVVGRVGATGRATGPHLHYETRINGEPVDPARFLKAGAGLFPG